MIVEEGDEVIPFSAMRELCIYEVFVTNIAPGQNIDNIKNHLKRKLCTDNISIKIMTKNDAPSISFGLFVRSESDTLNFRMPGLFPKGTGVYKWNTRAGEGRVPTRPARYHDRSTRGNNHNGQSNSAVSSYSYPYPDQQRLHDQNV